MESALLLFGHLECAMMTNQKYYVVWEGRQPGIFRTWDECKAQIDHFPNAKYKSYNTYQEAETAYKRGWKQSLFRSQEQMQTEKTEINYDSISVDVGCSGNPGIVEYKGVDTKTGDVLFYYGPIQKGTNNLGEFLAIVHALAYLDKNGSSKTIYSDSQTAISWVKNKEVRTNLVRDESTKDIWILVERALQWLNNNKYSNKILKWDTKNWGEIKADFGRK